MAAQDEPFVGKVLRKRTLTVSDAVLADFCAGLQIDLPPGALVPSTLATGPDGDYFVDIAYPYQVGHLWMRQGWEVLAPLQRGATYTSSGEIVDIYDRRDRRVVHYATTLADAGGRPVLRTAHHQSFLREAPPAGTVNLRDPARKPGASRFAVPDGTRFGGISRTITVAMCGTFFHGNANYHTDRAASQALGFRDIVVGGRMTMSLAGHVLEQHFGEPWWHGGRFDLKFINPVWAGETVTAHGVDTGPLAGDASRRGAFVWLQKGDGTVVLVLEARVPRR